MTLQISKDILLDFFENNFNLDIGDIDLDTVLFSTGLIDSFNMINLIMFIEESCATRLKPSEITLDNLDTIERILTFLEKRA